MSAALVRLVWLPPDLLLCYSGQTHQNSALTMQTLTGGHVPVLPPPISPLMWLSVNPGSEHFPSPALFKWSHSSATFTRRAGPSELYITITETCRSHLSCVKFDIWNEISDFVTKCVRKDCRVSPCTDKTKKRRWHCSVYCTISLLKL